MGNLPTERRVGGSIDHTHPTFTEFRDDLEHTDATADHGHSLD
jgi:hypothetical protein